MFYESEGIRKEKIEERIGQLFGRDVIAVWKPKGGKGSPFSVVNKMIKEKYEKEVETITMFNATDLFVANIWI